eukprot:scaffold10672_cov47-Phaeocystis_antarctica.AAC.1
MKPSVRLHSTRRMRWLLTSCDARREGVKSAKPRCATWRGDGNGCGPQRVRGGDTRDGAMRGTRARHAPRRARSRRSGRSQRQPGN